MLQDQKSASHSDRPIRSRCHDRLIHKVSRISFVSIDPGIGSIYVRSIIGSTIRLQTRTPGKHIRIAAVFNRHPVIGINGTQRAAVLKHVPGVRHIFGLEFVRQDHGFQRCQSLKGVCKNGAVHRAAIERRARKIQIFQIAAPLKNIIFVVNLGTDSPGKLNLLEDSRIAVFSAHTVQTYKQQSPILIDHSPRNRNVFFRPRISQ